MAKASNAEAAASKKPQWNGNAPSTESAKPTSPLAKQEIKSIPRVAKKGTTGVAGTAITEAEDRAMLEGEATESPYQKVRRLPIVFTVEYPSWY